MRRKRTLRESKAKYATKKKRVTVSIDPAQLARAPILLKRNGETIGAVISVETFRAFKTWESKRPPATIFPPEWHADKAAFQKMLPELLKTHREKWVAIHKGQMVDSDTKPGELMYRIELKFGDEPVYIDEVLEAPRVYRIPSIWKVKE